MCELKQSVQIKDIALLHQRSKKAIVLRRNKIIFDLLSKETISTILNNKMSLELNINKIIANDTNTDNNMVCNGFSWHASEDIQLQCELKQSINILEIAIVHKRSVGAITSRIQKLETYKDKFNKCVQSNYNTTIL